MNVTSAIKEGNGKTISIEIIPPGIEENIEDLIAFLGPLVESGIKWVDITYHPQSVIVENDNYVPHKGRSKPGTLGVSFAILNKFHDKIFPVPHVICSSFSKFDTQDCLI